MSQEKKRPLTIIKQAASAEKTSGYIFPFDEPEALMQIKNIEKMFSKIHIKRCDSLDAAFKMSETFRRLYEASEAKRKELADKQESQTD